MANIKYNKQFDKMINHMLSHPEIEEWYATDFQSEDCFIGYEASARMSELKAFYPDIFIPKKRGKYRTLSVNWENEKDIKALRESIDTRASIEK